MGAFLALDDSVAHTLTVLPKGSPDASLPRVVTLVRDEIQLEDQRAKAQILDLPNAQGAPLRLGVIDLPTFYAGMSEQGGNAPDAIKLQTANNQSNPLRNDDHSPRLTDEVVQIGPGYVSSPLSRIQALSRK